MSSNRCFRLIPLVLVSLVLAAGVAGAVTISDQDAPSSALVGSQVSSTFTFSNLYQNPSYESWTLQGQTELENVTWTVELLNQAGAVQGQQSYDGSEFQQPISLENDVATVNVQITGTVPPVQNFTYSPAPSFVFASFELARQGGSSAPIQEFETQHYTQESQEARTAIDEAQTAIDEAGGNQQAQTTLNNAISAYEAENFGNAIDLANQAQQRATSAQQQSQLIQYAIFAVIGLVILIAIVGGVYWYRKQQRGGTL